MWLCSAPAGNVRAGATPVFTALHMCLSGTDQESTVNTELGVLNKF